MKTALFDWHVKQGAKMVPFAGYDMPVQYPLGVLKEHEHTRTQAGLFDVSHMGQVRLYGENIAQALEKLVPGDMLGLPIGEQRYTVLTNENGGVIDDLMVLNRGDYWHLVVNADCKREDIAYLQKNLPSDIELKELTDLALIALQGPKASEIIASDVVRLGDYKFMSAFDATIAGIDCLITRSGYTGEDGFEISCSNRQVEDLVSYLCKSNFVEPVGLGARDSLRLEAGLCLYGHDLNTEITPIEANLKWVVGKNRRSGDRANFSGAERILEQLSNGADQQRVGLAIDGRAPVREGVVIQNAEGEEVGRVCSGGFSPTLKKPIAMAYVDIAYAALDTPLFAEVRNKLLPVSVSRLPFVANNYYR